MASLYMNTYRPLIWTRAGRDASTRYDLPPFVDGSIRREPDLEHQYPSISCLCRGGQFAPRLLLGDVVVYLAKKNSYGGTRRHWRMTAVLRVVHVLDDHQAAAQWYRARGLTLPNNCLVKDNLANPISHSHRHNRQKVISDEVEWQRRWDLTYQARVRKHRTFIICEPMFIDLTWNCPEVHEEDLIEAMGHVPTRNPCADDISHLDDLMRRLGITIPPSRR